jgi:hypothetical protein
MVKPGPIEAQSLIHSQPSPRFAAEDYGIDPQHTNIGFFILYIAISIVVQPSGCV